MKYLLWLPLFFPTLINAQEGSNYKGINFEKGLSWQQVKAKAKAENKFVFVDAYTTWCGPCKMMDRDVYTNVEVGDYLNNKFISVKIQMDKTDQDDQDVRSMYIDAKILNDQYEITAFPSFLFFNPDGELIHRGMGFQDPGVFISTASFALDPRRQEYYTLMRNYESGTKDYHVLGDLIITTREVIRNKELASKMAVDYKENYLNNLSWEQLMTKDNIEFAMQYYALVNSKDNFFKLFYYQSDKVDSIRNFKGGAFAVVNYVVEQEELEQKLWQNNKPIYKNPDWNKLQKTISRKYPKIDAEELIFQYQTRLHHAYYKRTKDWSKLVKYTEKIIDKMSSQNPPDGFGINMIVWNNFFLECDDRKVLEKALEWSNLSIKLEPSNSYPIQQLDTRANLLYKLGRKQEAIEEEAKIVKTEDEINQGADPNSVYKMTLTKMQKGLPTWSTD